MNNIYYERMIPVNTYKHKIRCWAEDNDEGDSVFEILRKEIATYCYIYGEKSMRDLAELLLSKFDLNAVEVLDEYNRGSVLYKKVTTVIETI
jgi:hypothetical protein